MRKTLQELRYKCGRHNTDSAIPDRCSRHFSKALSQALSRFSVPVNSGQVQGDFSGRCSKAIRSNSG